MIKLNKFYEKPGDGEKNTYNVDISEDMTKKDVLGTVLEILNKNQWMQKDVFVFEKKTMCKHNLAFWEGSKIKKKHDYFILYYWVTSVYVYWDFFSLIFEAVSMVTLN